MLSTIAYPAVLRALFGVDELPEIPASEVEIAAAVDLPAIRLAVDAVLRGAGL
jgi:hypothetical protein